MGTKIKLILSDGYIELRKNGNTFFGPTAHELMHVASVASRETGFEFQICIETVVKQFQEKIKEMA